MEKEYTLYKASDSSNKNKFVLKNKEELEVDNTYSSITKFYDITNSKQLQTLINDMANKIASEEFQVEDYNDLNEINKNVIGGYIDKCLEQKEIKKQLIMGNITINNFKSFIDPKKNLNEKVLYTEPKKNKRVWH